MSSPPGKTSHAELCRTRKVSSKREPRGTTPALRKAPVLGTLRCRVPLLCSLDWRPQGQLQRSALHPRSVASSLTRLGAPFPSQSRRKHAVHQPPLFFRPFLPCTSALSLAGIGLCCSVELQTHVGKVCKVMNPPTSCEAGHILAA